MAKSNAATVQEYLDELPEDRRSVISTVRDVILRNLPEWSGRTAWTRSIRSTG